MITAVEAWVEGPVQAFVRDARVLLALLLHPSGQVVAQSGWTRAVDVMSACALAAAIHASAGELGRLLDGHPFRELHHAGEDRQLYLAEAKTPIGPYIFVTVFEQESSLGLVRLYFEDLCRQLGAASSPLQRTEPVLSTDFDHDLNRNLAALFGRA